MTRTDTHAFGRAEHTRALAILLAGSAIAAGTPAHANGTPAGTVINNTATATYSPGNGGDDISVPSNTVSLTVDELLDVTVVSGDPGDVTTTPSATSQVTTFTVTNTGNGSEAFALTANGTVGGDDFDPTITSIVLDGNGNGVYDPGVDTVYQPGTNDPVIAPDGSVTVFVLSTIPAGGDDGDRAQVTLTAEAETGTGTPGTSFAGAGQGGGDAVVGSTGADGVASGFYVIHAARVAFVKSAVVADPFGGSQPVPGATITYTLVATTSGTGNLANLRVADPIPSGTTYQPGTLTLQGSTLTDASDGDSGEFTGSGIAVRLGTVAAGQARTMTFKVKID